MALSADKKLYAKSISSFAVPAVMENLLLTLVGTVNAALVGTLGDAEVGAVAVAVALIDIVRAVFQGFSMGGTVAISHFADDDAYCRKITCNAVVVNVMTALLLGSALFFTANGLLSLLFHRSAAIIQMATDYVRLAALALPLLAADITLSYCMRGKGDAKTPFFFAICVNIVNFALSMLFIFGLQMGVRGAALSYVISTALGCVSKFIWVIFNKKSKLRLTRFYRPNLKVINLVASIGLPNLIEQLMINTAALAIQWITGMMGEGALAGYNSANNVLKLTYCLTGGLESTQVTLVGQSLGRKNNDLARKYAYGILKLGEVGTCILGALMFIFARPLVYLLGSGLQPQTLDLGVHMLRILVFSIPLTSAFQCGQGTMRNSLRDVRFIMMSNTLSPWLVRVPLAFVLVRFAKLDVYGMIIALFSDYTVRALHVLLRLRKEHWIEKE